MLSGTCVPELPGLISPSSSDERDRQPDRGEQQEQRQRVAQQRSARAAERTRRAARAPGCADAPDPSARRRGLRRPCRWRRCRRRRWRLARRRGPSAGVARGVRSRRSCGLGGHAGRRRGRAAGGRAIARIASAAGARSARERRRSARPERHTRAVGKAMRVHKNDTSRIAAGTLSQNRSHRSDFTESVADRACRRGGVHKNETPSKSAGDSLRRRVTPIAAHTASIDARSCFPTSVIRARAHTVHDRKGATTCARIAPSSSRWSSPSRSPLPAGAAAPAPDHRRLDLGAAARPETRHAPTTRHTQAPRAEGRRRPVRHRHQRRGERPLRHRRLLARPDQGRRPERPRVHEDRPRRRVHHHQHRSNPIAQPLPGNRRRNLHRADPRLEPGAGREDLRPDRPVRPRRRLRYAGRLPAHLPRRKPEDLAERHGRRPPTASSRTRWPATSRRSASCRSPTPPA